MSGALGGVEIANVILEEGSIPFAPRFFKNRLCFKE
jgi:hypothetical protein